MPAAAKNVVTLKIDKLVHGGDGLGRFDGLAVFVPRTAPQDVVQARIVSRRKHFLRAELLEILQDHRRRQYEILTDAVYAEKGFDTHGIPLDETLERLGFTDPGYREIVRQARLRVERERQPCLAEAVSFQ
jgi:predicted RNA-binding protein with TRAM domain